MVTQAISSVPLYIQDEKFLYSLNSCMSSFASLNYFFFFFNPFSEKVFEGVVRRLVNMDGGKLILYYPSEAYVAWLDRVPEVARIDTIDCGDLFNGKDDRERIEVYRLRKTDMP